MNLSAAFTTLTNSYEAAQIYKHHPYSDQLCDSLRLPWFTFHMFMFIYKAELLGSSANVNLNLLKSQNPGFPLLVKVQSFL